MAQLLCGRALQGLGGGGMIAGAYVGIARGYPDALRARMFALNSSVWILPAVLGPAASGKITEAVGWRWVFLGILPFLLACAALVLVPLRRFDVRLPWPSLRRVHAAIQLAAGVALMLAAPSLRGYGRWASAALIIVGLAIAYPGFRAVLPTDILRLGRGLPTGLVIRGLLGFSFFGTEAFIPLAATKLRGATPTQAGLALSAGAFGWIVCAWLGERIESAGHVQSRALRIRVGFVLLALGIAWVAGALYLGAPLWVIPIGWVLSGAGTGTAFPTNTLVCIAAAPPGAEGDVSGQLQLTESLGTSIGAGLGGATLAALERAGYLPQRAQLVVFSLTLSAALVGVVVAPRVHAR
jgi:MFS family permease